MCTLARRGDALNVENQLHKIKPQNEHADADKKWKERRPRPRLATNDRCGRGAGIILQIRISVDGDAVGSFKRLQIRCHIDIEKLPVNKQETFGVGEAGKTGKIFRFNFLDA